MITKSFLPSFFRFPLNSETQKSWLAFKKRKRAYWSLWAILVLLLASLFANVYATSKPFIVSYNGSYYFPFFKTYPETTFGGIFETEPDYADTYVKNLIREGQNWAWYAPIKWDYASINQNPELQHPSPPSAENWLGTDNRGRDVLSRLVYGFRISILFGVVLAIIDACIGILIGAVEGFFGGWTDIILQRLIEIWSAIPFLYLLIILASIFEPSIPMLIFLLSLSGWIGVQGLVRIEFFKARNREYVKAARALGVSNTKIMFRHILPNALTLVITNLPFSISAGMVALVSLDYLGFGVKSPTPSLGELLNQGLTNLNAWWIALPTVGLIATMLILVTFVGEAVLDVFDPKRR
jgi:microcin C transport system permease protein